LEYWRDGIRTAGMMEYWNDGNKKSYRLRVRNEKLISY
jgi:hypothetical protein